MSFDFYKRMMQLQGNTNGEIYKKNSDEIMEQTWTS